MALRNVKSAKARYGDLRERISQYDDRKLKSFLNSLFLSHVEICEGRAIKANIGLMIGVGAGAGGLKCLLSDGTVRRYLNASLSLEAGIGFRTGVVRTTSHGALAGKVGSLDSSFDHNSTTVVAFEIDSLGKFQEESDGYERFNTMVGLFSAGRHLTR